MAKDIEAVPAGTATVAARLCNFPTAHSELLPSHRLWIDRNVIPAIRDSSNPWVDVFGYASHLGDATFNKKLSDKRCAAVIQYIRSFVPKVLFPQDIGYGESRSGGGAKDDDGYWRAVELYVYAAGRPPAPPKPPKPPTPQILDDWFVTEFTGRTESVVVTLGYSAMEGYVTFTRADGTKYRGPIGMFGLSAGVSLNLGKLPGLDRLLARFPALRQLLGGSAPLANDLLKWALKPGILRQIINKTPGGMRLYNALLSVILGGNVAPDWFPPTKAIGMVFPFRPPLNTNSFYGSCMCYAATATATIASGGTYVLFFGYRGKMYSTDFFL